MLGVTPGPGRTPRVICVLLDAVKAGDVARLQSLIASGDLGATTAAGNEAAQRLLELAGEVQLAKLVEQADEAGLRALAPIEDRKAPVLDVDVRDKIRADRAREQKALEDERLRVEKQAAAEAEQIAKRAADAAEREAKRQAAALAEQARRRDEVIEGLKREADEAARLGLAQSKGVEAQQALAVQLEIEAKLREANVSASSAEGQRIADLIKLKTEEAEATELLSAAQKRQRDLAQLQISTRIDRVLSDQRAVREAEAERQRIATQEAAQFSSAVIEPFISSLSGEFSGFFRRLRTEGIGSVRDLLSTTANVFASVPEQTLGALATSVTSEITSSLREGLSEAAKGGAFDFAKLGAAFNNPLGAASLGAFGGGILAQLGGGNAANGAIGASECGPAALNASGRRGVISATGFPTLLANNIVLRAEGLTQLAFGYFIASRDAGLVVMPGGSAGTLCLGGSIGRVVGGAIANTGAAGSMAANVDALSMPSPTGSVAVAPGETWRFQCWFRDSSPAGSATSNFTDAIAIRFE